MSDLTIGRLCQILRVNYQEKSATELYQELIAMKQEKCETPSQFLIRALEVREKIVFAAKGDGDSVKYTKDMVQGLFNKTIESGVEEGMSGIIRPILKSNVSDVELIQEMSTAESVMKLRQQKGQSDKKNVKICAAVLPEESEMMKMMVGMQKQLESMTSEISALKKDREKKEPFQPIRRPAYTKCTKDGKTAECKHCIKCGKEGPPRD